MKKKLLLCLIIGFTFASANLSANSWGEKILLYIPNRILDLTDLFSVSLGVGPTVRAELMVTEAIKVGAGYDYCSYRAFKEWNRQYGFAKQDGWYYSAISAGEERTTRSGAIGSVDNYSEASAGVADPMKPIYNYYEGKRDFYRFGGALGLLIEGELYINPIEWVDLLTGFFFIDIRQDDFELQDF